MNERFPKYRALAQDYRTKVESGELPAGTPLESRRRLARMHGTSRVTMDKVVELLTADGILEPSDGNRPPMVADISGRTATAQSRVANAAATGRALGSGETSQILSVMEVPCPADLAHALDVTPGGMVLRRDRLNLVDGHPVAMGYSYYPSEVVTVAPELRESTSIPSGSRELAAQRMCSAQKDLVTKVTSRLATDRERELLKLGGTYVVVTQLARQVLLANGRTVEVAVKVAKGDRPVSFHSAL